MHLVWQSPFARFVLESAPALPAAASWTPVQRAATESEGTFRVQVLPGADARFYRLRLPLTQVTETSPRQGELGVSVGRETVVRFSSALASTATVGLDRFYALHAGRRLLTRVEVSQDRRRATLFYLEPLPGNARLTVVFNGDDLQDEWGWPLDADGDGVPGGEARFWFDTLNLTAIAGTAVVGNVYAAEPETGADGSSRNRPLAGVTVSVDGREQDLRAVTDAQGFFRLQPVPAGRFFVHIDGRTALDSAYPNGAYYPTVGKSWDAVAGVTTNLAGGTGEIFLPRIQGDAMVSASASQATVVSFAPAVVEDHPELAQARIVVPPNSLYANDGNRGGRIGLAPVPSDRLPGPLPTGLELPSVFTVQTDGPGNFDRPASVCLPNIPQMVPGAPLPPGTRRDLISFDHKKGVWESVGPMSVAADGSLLCTDPGVGIREPGWHGAGVPAFRGSPNVGSGPGTGTGTGAGASGGSSGGAGSGTGGDGVLGGSAPGGHNPGSPGSGGGGPSPGGSSGSGSGSGGGGPGGGGPGGGGGGGADSEPSCPEGGLDPCLARANAEKKRCDEAKHASLDKYGKQCQEAERRLGRNHPAVRACLDSYARLYFQATLNCNQLKTDFTAACAPCVPGDVMPSPLLAGPMPHPAGAASSVRPHGVPGASEDLLELLEQAGALLASYVMNDQEIPEAARLQAEGWIAQAESRAGGDLGMHFFREGLLTEELGAAVFLSFGEDPGNAPPYPVPFRAVVDRPEGLFSIRGETEAFGAYQFFVPQDGLLLHIEFYDPRAGTYAIVFPNRSPGSALQAPRLHLHSLPVDAPDRDGDGLPDFAEVVLGTHPENPDTDGDGVPDGTEVAQGADPLDGIAVRPGVIAAVEMPGRAVDVAADDDLAIVAAGQSGVAVFDLANPLRPILAAQVDTPGDARGVAMSARHVAVADGPQGLAILDLTAALPLRVRQQLNLGSAVVAVAADRGTAFAALESREIVAVDLFTGLEHGRTRLTGGQPIQDLIVHREVLYVLTSTELLAMPRGLPPVEVASRVSAPGLLPGSFRRKRLAAAEDRLYASHRQGFTVFDVAQPLAPVALQDHVTPQFGWKQLVPVQPGLAVAPLGPDSTEGNAHHLHLYDLGPTGTNAVFLTTLTTPGVAVAVAPWKGLAYVADDRAGLQVVHFRPPQNIATPPFVTLGDPALGNPTAVAEGQPFSVAARAVDDDLVRAVEFYLDDTLAATAGRAPFTRTILAPLRTPDRTSISLRARAIDVAGNAAWSDPFVVSLSPDTQPPEVMFTAPGDGRHFASLDGIVIGAAFSKHLDPATLSTTSFRLLAPGPTGGFGDADERVIESGRAGYRADVQTAWRSIPESLPPGTYRAVLTPDIADPAGNRLRDAVTWEFHVVHADLTGGGFVAASGAIERPGVRDELAFVGRAGQALYFDEVTGTCTSGIRWRCVAPDQSVLFEETLGGLGCGVDAGLRVLPADGTYQIVIDGQPGVVHPWSIALYDVPQAQPVSITVGTPVLAGQPTPGSGRIETPGSSDLFHFQGSAGQRVFFEEPLGTCNSPFRWSATSPSGDVLFEETLGGTGCGRHAGRLTLPESGQYAISVRGMADATGDYAFTVWDATPQTFEVGPTAEIAPGQPGAGAGHLETPGTADIYRFHLAAGTTLRFEAMDAVAALTSVTWRLLDPSGTALFTACLGCTDPGSVHLAVPGQYTIVVGDDTHAGTGTYRLRWGP
ncbi:MAG: Ig-like domain-containing protein [Verrucomicrobiae bacterium]|nr:Ig-like domain-containing protein [Verrucomicrobiae bacterium]